MAQVLMISIFGQFSGNGLGTFAITHCTEPKGNLPSSAYQRFIQRKQRYTLAVDNEDVRLTPLSRKQTVIYNNLGYTKVATQLALNLANSVCSAIGAVTAAFLTDRMPRRKVLIPGTFGE